MHKSVNLGPSKAIVLSLAGILLLPIQAQALPTPDILVGFANLLPLLTGAVLTLAGGGYYLLKKRVVPRTGEFIAGTLFGLLLLLVVVLGITGYSWNKGRQEEHIKDLAIYLRCDFSAHESLANSKQGRIHNRSQWHKYGHFQSIPIGKVAAKLHKQPDAALIATYRTGIAYHSGIPAIKLDGNLKPFEYVRKNELTARLSGTSEKDLYLIGFSTAESAPAEYPQLQPVFKQFEHIYIVTGVNSHNRYVARPDGSLHPIDTTTQVIDWPVRKERWIKDEQRVKFPGMTHLLDDDEVVKLLADDRVQLVAPFDSSLRLKHTYLDVYLKRLLTGIDPNRIFAIDMNSSWASRALEKLAGKLDGKPFLVIGISKYDWVYSGLDCSFNMWEKFAHDPKRFQLLGFTTRLPEAVAVSWMSAKSPGLIEQLKEPFWNSLGWLKRELNISGGAAIFLFAVLLRLVFSPIGIREANSRMIRLQVKQAADSESRPLWNGSTPELLHHLGANGGWELFGNIITLILIMPAYRLLSSAPERLLQDGFFWIERLDNPDISLSIFIGALICIKLMLGKGFANMHIYIPLSAVFSLFLCFLPSSLLLYVSGVLLVTTAQDSIALQSSRRSLRRALLGVGV